MPTRSLMASSAALALLALILTAAGPFSIAASAQSAPRVFELRTYTAHPGKFEAMRAVPHHIIPLFKKHGLTLIGFWTYADTPGSDNSSFTFSRTRAGKRRRRTGRRFSPIPSLPEGLDRDGEGWPNQLEGRVGVPESRGFFPDTIARRYDRSDCYSSRRHDIDFVASRFVGIEVNARESASGELTVQRD